MGLETQFAVPEASVPLIQYLPSICIPLHMDHLVIEAETRTEARVHVQDHKATLWSSMTSA